MSDAPLKGWRIVVTRAQGQAGTITEQLSNLGATVINIPTIEICPPATWAEIDAAIQKISSYDWLIFTRTNGVDFFFRRLRELNATLPPRLKVCAVGKITAGRLNAIGINVDLTPTENRGEGLFEALKETIGDDRLSKMRFLFPRAQEGREELPDGLRQLGALVDVVEAYRTVLPAFDKNEITKRFGNGVDLVVFSSPSSVKNLAAMLGESFNEVLDNAHIACIGPTTSEQANRFGLHVVIEPAEQNSAKLVEEIVNFRLRNAG